MIQKSKRLKNIKLVLGGVFIAISGHHLFNIVNPTPLYVVYPGIAVLAVGIINILRGVFNKQDSKTVRTIWFSIGITAIIVGLYIFTVFQEDATSRANLLFFVFIIIQGVGFILTGITQRGKGKLVRTIEIIIGIIFILLTGIFLEDPKITHVMISVLLSIHIFLIGIGVIKSARNDGINNSPNTNYDKSSKGNSSS